MNRILMPACALIVSVCLLWMIKLASDSARAFAYEHRVYMNFQSWYASGKRPDLSRYQEQEELITAAMKLLSNNASIRNTAGRLYEYRAFQFGSQSATVRRQYAVKAAEMYRLASRESPVWVYPWMNLAIIKMRSGEWDQEFIEAYRKAVMLGPWESATMPTLVEVGLTVYQNVDQPSQQIIGDYIDRVAAGAGPMISAELAKRGNRSAMCWRLERMGHPKAYQRICNPAAG